MDHIYEDDDFELSTRDQSKRCQDLAGYPPPSTKTLKVLLVAVSLLLLCALVALCALGILYCNKSVSCESLRGQCASAMEKMSVQLRNATETERKYKDLKVNYSTVHEVCSTCRECGQCGDGWRSLGVKCYYFSTDFLNWMNSRDRCVEKGGHLVIITSQAEQLFVNSSGETLWIGLNDLETEGKWMWVNNQSLTETGVTLWFKRKDGFPDEPDNWKYQNPLGENCASLGDESGHTHSWFDSSCSKLKKYICEK